MNRKTLYKWQGCIYIFILLEFVLLAQILSVTNKIDISLLCVMCLNMYFILQITKSILMIHCIYDKEEDL